MKSYRAIRHDITRTKQNKNLDELHHPNQKINQIYKYLKNDNLKILELFAGRGNLSNHYKKFGILESYDKKYLKTGDSFLNVYNLIYNKKTYDVIDIDPYGFPNRFFPHIYLLIQKGYIFLTMPKPSVNILNGITRTHLISYFDNHNPNINEIINQLATWGLCHWRKVEVLDILDLKSIYRIALKVEKVKSTDYTGVKNRSDLIIKEQTKQIKLWT
tara:strand:+ start:197 stop:844 length:648 start_codon:yes stop_codon:yes gene_type:complete